MHRVSLVLLVAMAGCSSRQPLVYSGVVDARVAAVASPAAGQVRSVPVHVGAFVKKGDLLAQLDARALEAAVAVAEANHLRATARLRQAEQDLRTLRPLPRVSPMEIARAQAAQERSELEYQRVRRVVEAGAAPSSKLDLARGRMLAARAHLASLLASRSSPQARPVGTEAAVAEAQSSLRSAEATLAQARVQLAQTQVLAPFDGLVSELVLQEGEWAARGAPVLMLEDRSQLWVRVDVSEQDYSEVRPNQPAEVRVLARPERTFRGRVIEIGGEGDAAQRAFRLRVGIDPGDDLLRPGMTAEVRLVEESEVAASAASAAPAQ